ncbi:MAG: VanZ family protein [Bacteroidetes bacterium]|nr:VanZ family protein [Bacteroidota bacterium]
MTLIKPIIKFFSWIMLAIFMVLLTKVVLFKNSPRYYKNYFKNQYANYHVADGVKKANFVPLTTIKLFYNSRRLNFEYKVENLLGNIVAFMPLGFLLPLLIKRSRRFYKILIAGFLLSVFFECSQLFAGIGVFDVDDIILNTLGSILGYLPFVILKAAFPSGPPVMIPASRSQTVLSPTIPS